MSPDEIAMSFDFRGDMLTLLDAYWRGIDDVLLALVLGAGISPADMAISFENGERILWVHGAKFCKFTLELKS